MLEGLAADTSVITYLMAGIGILGILAKIINQLTLMRLVKAAGNMPKSTHRLIKLVRAKYEHACMIHDSVGNINAFVEKYIYEYRGVLFRIHTWRQIEILSVWFAGILAAMGAFLQYYLYSGFEESVYQYIAAGIAETVLLSVVMRLSDEPYKINAVKVYMVDYLENICAFRLRKQSQREREFIDVISSEGNGKAGFQPVREGEAADGGRGYTARNRKGSRIAAAEGMNGEKNRAETGQESFAESGTPERKEERAVSIAAESVSETEKLRNAEPETAESQEGGLSIHIEGEPRRAEKGEAARQAVRRAAADKDINGEDERPALREEAIRQILEEFLA